MRSYRQHCGMEYHLSGIGNPFEPPLAMTIRARLGVISGRRATGRSPLSVKAYSCCVTSSPALRVYKAEDSRTGASYSWKAYWAATVRHWSNSHDRRRMSGG